MKRIAMMMIAALLCAPSYAGTPAFNGDRVEAVAVPPKPQRREAYCEAVGSGLWDCEEEVCGDWIGGYTCGCYIVTYRRDDPL